MTQLNSEIVTPKSSAALWDIDTSHARAGFKVRHMMVSHVRGELGPVSGSVLIDEQRPERSRVEVSIDVRALDTREPKRDEHLRSADFFDVEKHPSVTFVSTQVAPAKDGGFQLTGDLTIHGTTRSVTLEVEPLTPAIADPWGNVKRGASAKGSINRKDFGLTWNVALETGGILVGDQVAIEIELELTLRK
jgi:polyisoprenoid-binding protein YceI